MWWVCQYNLKICCQISRAEMYITIFMWIGLCEYLSSLFLLEMNFFVFLWNRIHFLTSVVCCISSFVDMKLKKEIKLCIPFFLYLERIKLLGLQFGILINMLMMSTNYPKIFCHPLYIFSKVKCPSLCVSQPKPSARPVAPF